MSDQKTWLISLSIGPVQDFISAALRTRDLWFGSHMLSEVSREAARKMNTYDAAELIFPAVEKNSNELEPDSLLNVANRIVAEVQGDNKTVEAIINAGKQAAQDQLDIFITQAKGKAAINLRDDIWDIQTKRENLLELYGTAVRITDGKYPDAWERLSRLNSARKNSRDFLQPAKAPNEEGLYGLPKSSLDGRRETVLPKELSKNARRRLRMGDGEQLDVLGLVKRLAGDNPDQFTPTTRIAIDPWIREIKEAEDEDPEKTTLVDIQGKMEELIQLERSANLRSAFVTRVMGNKEKGENDQEQSKYRDMPFDAGLLYRSFLDATISKTTNEQDAKEVNSFLKGKFRSHMNAVWKEYRQPCPYYAMLLADGDHMGALIKAAEGKKQHQEISRQLSKFAQQVPELARTKQAHCIYAGGDDVLLMAPLDTVLDLAEELRQKFAENLKGIADDLDRADEPPTFSVGIVIAHMQTPIGRVRRLVGEAEALAKGSDREDPRNALAIIVAPRSGADIPLRARWDTKPVNGLNELANL
ncbi:MAG: type III-B CRISPR-associated protein Cas10/Cmr2, partial [Candidatus Electrothrix sp. GM3_4]|nr:type III-B CRISPR-associated protein Cas10/Cmr2 [Candidatus Electrothrix sp. GM3_4]